MNMNKVGKFEGLKILNAFDSALIEMYGINMTDARITRYEVLSSYGETGCVEKSAELLAQQRGLKRLAASA